MVLDFQKAKCEAEIIQKLRAPNPQSVVVSNVSLRLASVERTYYDGVSSQVVMDCHVEVRVSRERIQLPL